MHTKNAPLQIVALVFVFILLVGLVIAVLTNTRTAQQPVRAVLTPPVPVPPTAVLVSSAEEARGFYTIYHGAWSVTDSVPFMAAWYEQALRRDGWEITIPPLRWTDTNLQYMEFQKNDTFAHISVEKNSADSSTTIAVDVVPGAITDEMGEE